MIKANTNSGKASGDVFRCVVNFLEGSSLPRECACNLVDKYSTCQASTADNLALRATNSNVVTYDYKLDPISLVWMKCCILLFGKAKVEDIASVVSWEALGYGR